MDSNGIYHFYDKDGNIPSIIYYDDIGRKVNNETGQVISSSVYTDQFGIERDPSKESNNPKGAVVITPQDSVEMIYGENNVLKRYRLLRTYLLSNYRIYTLKNSDETFLKDIGSMIRKMTGGDSDGWAKGLIKLYNSENGKATGHWTWVSGILGDSVSITDTTLTLKKGWFNNPMNFSIEGWAPRYGMSLEFLLSLHLGTNAPDLVYAMLQNFDTEIQVYIDDSGKSKVNARYIDPKSTETSPSSGDSLDKIKSVLGKTDHPIAETVINDKAALEWVNGFVLSKKVCQSLLTSNDLTLKSPDNCLGGVSAYVIEDCTSEVEKVFETNPLDNYGITEDKADAGLYTDVDTYKPNTFNATIERFF